MAERLGAVRVQAEALTTLGILPGLSYEEAVSTLTRAIELAESAGLLEQAGRAHNNLGVHLDDAQASREHFLRAAELDRQRGETLGEICWACSAAYRSLLLGDFAEVEEVLPSLRQLLDAAEKPGVAALWFGWLEAMLLRYQGELAAAIEGLRSLRTEARATGDLQWLQLLNLELAMACIREEVGEGEKVEAILQEILDIGDWSIETATPARCLLSVQRARQGEPGAARHLLTEAQEQAVERGGFFVEPYLSWAEANVALAEGHWPEALAAFEAAVETVDRRKLRWYRARTLVDWAEAHLARGEPGDLERAGELLREAEAEFRAMGAPLYVERVKARLEELGATSPVTSSKDTD
jgi:tetratricopeptide (TPR) repeat protein